MLNLASTVWIIWVFLAKRLLQLNMFFSAESSRKKQWRMVTESLASNSADHMTSPSLCVAKAEKMISVRFRCRSYDHFLRDSSNQWCVITNSWIVITTYDLHERQEVATDENNWYSPLPFLQNFKIHFFRKHPSRVKSTSVSLRQFSYLQSNEAVLSEVEHYNYRALYRVQFPNNLEFKNILPSNVNDHNHMCGGKTLSRILYLTSEKIPLINTLDT